MCFITEYVGTSTFYGSQHNSAITRHVFTLFVSQMIMKRDLSVNFKLYVMYTLQQIQLFQGLLLFVVDRAMFY